MRDSWLTSPRVSPYVGPITPAQPSIIDRLKRARFVQVLLVYLGATSVVLQLVDTLVGLLSLPGWVGPVAVVLLGVGLVVVLATACVQSLPSTTTAALESYRGFLAMWADADPTLPPKMEAAEAVRRLGG